MASFRAAALIVLVFAAHAWHLRFLLGDGGAPDDERQCLDAAGRGRWLPGGPCLRMGVRVELTF